VLGVWVSLSVVNAAAVVESDTAEKWCQWHRHSIERRKNAHHVEKPNVSTVVFFWKQKKKHVALLVVLMLAQIRLIYTPAVALVLSTGAVCLARTNFLSPLSATIAFTYICRLRITGAGVGVRYSYSCFLCQLCSCVKQIDHALVTVHLPHLLYITFIPFVAYYRKGNKR